MGLIKEGAIQAGTAYVGYVDIQDRTSEITTGLNHLLRQTYDPISLGYQIRIERDGHWRGQPESGSQNMAPIWMVDRTAWEQAGGRTIATSDPLNNPTTTSDEGTATTRVSLGTLALGQGRIVFIGALLPDPTDKYPHWFGLNGYGPTGLGHHLFQKAVTWSRGADGILVAGPTVPAGTSPTLPLTSVATGTPLVVALALGLLAGWLRITRRRRHPH
jgi:hypothetical protein